MGTAESVLRARVVRRTEQKDRWDKEADNNVIGVPWTIVDGKWTVDRPMTQIDPLPPPPPPVPFEEARAQRERITRTDIEAFGTTAGCPGCNAIRSGKRAQAHSDPCRVRIEECLKTTPEGCERLDRRREALNEAIAKEVERNVRRRKEVGNKAGELAAPQELKDVPIPFDSDPRKTCDKSSDSSCEQRQHESRMDVEGEERETSPEIRKHRTPDDDQ